MPIRIILVEDHILLRSALKIVLEDHAGFKIVGETENEEDVLKLIKELQPDVILIDARLSNANVLGLIPQVLRWKPDTKMIVMTTHQNDPLFSKLLKLGSLDV